MAQRINAPLPEGTRVGEYRILRQLSSGGFSLVYLAVDRQGHRVAIKEYLPAALSLRAPGQTRPQIDDKHINAFKMGLSCFFEEGRSLAHIDHPNVVRVINFLRDHDTVYMVMEYEEGGTLQEYILYRSKHPKGRGLIDERRIAKIFVSLLRGLREVHSRRLLHLDIKPANIYLKRDGEPMLIDFGAARAQIPQEGRLPHPMYTPGFAAPELLERDSQRIGPWTDLYAVGASLFCCMLGQPPMGPQQRAVQDNVASRLQAAHAYSQALRDLCLDCLQLDPLARPQSGHAVQKRLEELLQAPSSSRWRRWLGVLGASAAGKSS